MTSHDRVQSALRRIDELMAQRHEEGLGPGLSLALTTNEELLATRTYGVANADSREPVTERTLFQIGSITKHFTAAACLRLHKQGRLDVNAPVAEVLDWFEVRSRFETPMTIHHLLTHTSGVIMMMDCSPSSWWQTWALRDTELGFEPGAKFSYSNVGYNVLQCVIQTITGLSFDASLASWCSNRWGCMSPSGRSGTACTTGWPRGTSTRRTTIAPFRGRTSRSS